MAEISRQEQLEAMGIEQLRKIAIDAGFKSDEVMEADALTLVASILDDESQ